KNYNRSVFSRTPIGRQRLRPCVLWRGHIELWHRHWQLILRRPLSLAELLHALVVSPNLVIIHAVGVARIAGSVAGLPGLRRWRGGFDCRSIGTLDSWSQLAISLVRSLRIGSPWCRLSVGHTGACDRLGAPGCSKDASRLGRL